MMKFKFLLITVLLSSLSAPLFANNLLDSIGVENLNGKKVILHKVDPKENFYSIARRYNVSPKSIIAFNNNAISLSIGQVIKVPTELPFLEITKAQPPVKTTTTPKTGIAANNDFSIRSSPVAETTASTTQYKVAAGETLYAISKRFNTTVADITALNNLKSTSLTPGQIILVRATPPPAVTAVQQPPIQQSIKSTVVTPPVQQLPTPIAKRDSTAVTHMDSTEMSHRNVPANRYGLQETNEKGVAVWLDNDNLDPSKKWVLHRSAAIGTIIKITNTMTNRTAYAKVVGRFSDNENTKDAIMVVTKSVAESIGAVDKRFHVTISYAPPNE